LKILLLNHHVFVLLFHLVSTDTHSFYQKLLISLLNLIYHIYIHYLKLSNILWLYYFLNFYFIHYDLIETIIYFVHFHSNQYFLINQTFKMVSMASSQQAMSDFNNNMFLHLEFHFFFKYFCFKSNQVTSVNQN